jgi:hypothetical protein
VEPQRRCRTMMPSRLYRSRWVNALVCGCVRVDVQAREAFKRPD